MSTVIERGTYLDAFTQLRQRAGDNWLRAIRAEAFARFNELGFPTTRHEDWRFTSVAAITQTSFALPSAGMRVRRADLDRVAMPGAACRLVFVDGRYSAELSRGTNLGDIKVGSLSEIIAAEPDLLQRHLARYADFHDDAFLALNTAFLEDGAVVLVPRGAVVEAPIYLLYVSTGGETPSMVHPRNLIIAGEQAQATVVEDYISLNSGTVFTNAVTELIARDDSVVTHYLLEREDRQALNVSTLRTQQGRAASVSSHSVLLGGALVRNNVHPVLAGEGGDCLINGLFIGAGRQHMDNYMKVEHAAPHCGSRQFYNGILDDHARGVFHGRIIVHKDAQKTDAKQTNRNLLLSNNAQIDTKPQLEIYADDVKCTHGATIGQIDEEALFYMRSRGLDERAARALLLFAFASESLERMKPGPVRNFLEELVPAWLPKGARENL